MTTEVYTRLTWIRTRDGESPSGRPAYEYNATGKDGVAYKIVWAYDHGGQFGWTARDLEGNELTLTQNVRHSHGIHWCRTLSACQDICNKIERGRSAPVKLVPNWAGEFRDFQHWVNTATHQIGVAKFEANAICVDTKGRRCWIGSDFMRARDEGTFPVRFFWDCKPE